MAATDFLSCDWGTTSFRLRWISGSERKLVGEIREKAGVRGMLEKAGADMTAGNRGELFARFLATKLEELCAQHRVPANRLPLVISGMASSSVGWKELPYARAPFAIDGRALAWERLEWSCPEWVGSTYLISGVATGNDMMRGEECEIIGLMSLPELARHRERCLLVLPGTHSKHVRIENGNVVDWRTYMTGELFDVLGQHSLLRASLDLPSPDAGPLVETHSSAFVEGVRAAQDLGLAAGLFRVRTRAVLRRVNITENTAFFSGLLIGAELVEIAAKAEDGPVVLAGTGALASSYACAMKTIAGTSTQWTRVPPDEVDGAVVTAHARFLANKPLA